MARIETVIACTPDELARRLRPRDDVLVREEQSPGQAPAVPPSGSATFAGADGPFRRYRRTIHWDEPGPDGEHPVVQQVDYSLAIPYWAPLYRPLMRRSLPDGPAPGTTPWWSTPDRLSPRQSTVVATMCMFNLVAGLLYGLLTQVLTFVSADLGVGTRSEQTTLLAVSRLGVVATIVAMVIADRVGRRKVAIASFGIAGVLTVATAASPTWGVLGALQLLSRNLAIAGLLCVDTISVEEVPAGSRAMTTGLGTLSYGLGAGVVVMTLRLADIAVWGWRLTFVVAGVSLPLIWHAARHLPESHRFEQMSKSPDPADRHVESRRIHGGRFVLLAAMFFLLNVIVAPASQLQNDYLRTEHAFSGLLISVFVVTTSTPGGIGVLVGGRLADIRGRRAAIIPGLLATAVFTAIFFSVSGVPLWFASMLSSVLGALAIPALGVIAPELFPTAHRGGVRGVLTGIAIVGSVAGLVFAGWMIDQHGYGPSFQILAVAPLIAAAFALAIPETRGRELEDLNG